MVVTQNTDGLHQRAGTPPDLVVELHGTMHVVICCGCRHRSPTAAVIARIAAGDPVPQCTHCGGILKTASTMFGQTVAPEVYARAERAVLDCDLVLAAGTTLTVEPAGSLCATAIRAGAALVIANWDPTPYDGIATDIIRDPLSESLPRIAAQLMAGPQSPPATPQASVSDGTGTGTGTEPGAVIRRELARLHKSSARQQLALTADTAGAAAVSAILCGAADEESALAALSHIPELADASIRIRAARWLRDVHPPAGPGPSPYWDDSLPDAAAEDLVAALVTPRFLLRMLADTTGEQDRRTLAVLARAPGPDRHQRRREGRPWRGEPGRRRSAARTVG
jgi:hypothetical protein